MSRIDELGDNFQNLPSLLEEYEEELAKAEPILGIKGKRLEQANLENPTWQRYFDQRRIELHTVVKYLEARVDSVRGKLYKNFTSAKQMEYSDRAKDKMINNEPAYLAVYEVYLEAKEMYDQYQSVVDAFQGRGYALNNITKIRVASLEDV